MSGAPSLRKRKSELLRDRLPALNAMFAPEAVAVIGATERPGSVGRAVLENLKSYRRPVYPVNLKRHRVLGVPAFPKIGAIPDHVDLAIIVTPATTVPEIVQECAEAGVTGAVVILAGFRECGPVGAKLEEAIAARRGQMRIVGPNCLGVMIPRLNLNATFALLLAKDGHLAFVSQSGSAHRFWIGAFGNKSGSAAFSR